MKKFLSKLLLFLLLLGVMVWLVARCDNADRNSNSDHNVLKIGHMSAFDSLNILFVGNSYCYSSIYSPLFDSMNRRTFNLGIATSGPRFYKLLLDDYLHSAKKQPDTIMLLLSPTTFSTQADNWKDYPIHRYLKHPISNEKLTWEFGMVKDYPAMVFNSVRKGLNNLFDLKNRTYEKELNKIFLYKGLFIDSTITSDSLEKAIRHLFVPLRKDHFDHEGAACLLKLTERMQALGMKVLFFETPTFHLSNYFSNEFMIAYEDYMKKMSGKYVVIRATEMDDRFFRNIDHNNTQGAYHYTRYLIEQLYGKH